MVRRIQSVVEEALSYGGLEPAIASSGEEALTLLSGSKYRILVIDIKLGKDRIRGWDVARRARAINPDLPVVYITGANARPQRRQLANSWRASLTGRGGTLLAHAPVPMQRYAMPDRCRCRGGRIPDVRPSLCNRRPRVQRQPDFLHRRGGNQASRLWPATHAGARLPARTISRNNARYSD